MLEISLSPPCSLGPAQVSGTESLKFDASPCDDPNPGLRKLECLGPVITSVMRYFTRQYSYLMPTDVSARNTTFGILVYDVTKMYNEK